MTGATEVNMESEKVTSYIRCREINGTFASIAGNPLPPTSVHSDTADSCASDTDGRIQIRAIQMMLWIGNIKLSGPQTLTL